MVLISAHPFHIKEIYRSSFEYFLRKYSIEIKSTFPCINITLHLCSSFWFAFSFIVWICRRAYEHNSILFLHLMLHVIPHAIFHLKQIAETQLLYFKQL